MTVYIHDGKEFTDLRSAYRDVFKYDPNDVDFVDFVWNWYSVTDLLRMMEKDGCKSYREMYEDFIDECIEAGHGLAEEYMDIAEDEEVQE